jgi:K+-transporting ATPase KdpF subunit
VNAQNLAGLIVSIVLFGYLPAALPYPDRA